MGKPLKEIVNTALRRGLVDKLVENTQPISVRSHDFGASRPRLDLGRLGGRIHQKPSALSPQSSVLSPQSSALSPQPSALSPQPSALSPQPSAHRPPTSPDIRLRDLATSATHAGTMPTACIHHPGSKVTLESERLIVSYTDEEGSTQKRELPLRDLERIILADCVSITSPALAESMRRSIPVSLIDSQGRFLGAFQPATPDHGAARLRHYQRTLEPDFTHSIARKIITAKIYNQRRLVQRVAANRRAEDKPVPSNISIALDTLDRAMINAGKAENLDSLRGYEGLAAARYFSAWSALLPEHFPFERRSTRPPLNPVNAVLSFASTMIYHEMHSFIHAHGLDPALGLLHTTENGRWSLALDLMEPFRPVLSEALTLDLFSHKMLNNTHFEPHDGGIYLNKIGRSKLILQYEKRMERQFMSECIGHRTTLRQQLENQAILLKSALNDTEKFVPFLMN